MGGLKAFFVLTLWGVLSAIKPATALADKPFRRAVVFTGGGLSASAYLGLYDGLVDAGWKPDLILSSCGSSIASALIHAFPDPVARKAYMTSPRYWRFLSDAKSDVGFFSALKLTLQLRFQLPHRDHPPDIFQRHVFDAPNNPDYPEFSQEISAREPAEANPRIIILTTRTRLRPLSARLPIPPGFKLHVESYFTDPDTAKLLQGRKSAVGLAFPDSHIAPFTETYTHISLNAAIRSGTSDPFIFNPSQRAHRYFLTGAVNLYPVELAHDLADEVLVVVTHEWSNIENYAYESVFGLSMNERRNQVLDHFRADYWADFQQINFGEKDTLFSPIALQGLRPRLGTPGQLDKFTQVVQEQYTAGFQEAYEALHRPQMPARQALDNPNVYAGSTEAMTRLERSLFR